MVSTELDQGPRLALGEGGAGWIRWRGEDHSPGVWADAFGNSLRPPVECAVAFGHGHRARAKQGRHRGVRRVAGKRVYQFVSGLEEGREHRQQTTLWRRWSRRPGRGLVVVPEC